MLVIQLFFLGVLAATGHTQGPVRHPKISSVIADHTAPDRPMTESYLQPGLEISMNFTGEGLQVYIEMGEVSEAMLGDLRALGASIEIYDPAQRLIQARVPVAQLEAVAELRSVKFIRLPDYGFHNRQGSVGTQGDAIVRTHLRRRQLAATGDGVSVGVLSDGIGGLTSSISSSDLPDSGITAPAAPLTGGGISLDSPLPGATVFTSTPIGRPDLTTGSEARAMLEIIHDLAPGAQLFFAPVGSTALEYQRAARWLVAQGVKIIADDQIFINVGPYDGTSAVSQEAAGAVASGVNYFVSVGNFARRHYRGLFTDTDGDTFHEFDASLGLSMVDNSGETLNVTISPFSTVGILLQWDDPFGAATNNYDLCVHVPPDIPSSPLFCSMDPQTGTQNPAEGIAVTNNGPTPATIGIRINSVGMAAPKVFDLFISGGVMNEFVVPERSVPNKADAGGGVFAVGAVNWLTPDITEPFSSRGPTADNRLKPDAVAPDVVSTSVPGFSPFAGTSAAAPHAAAAAALILSQNPGLTPSQLADQLRGTAVDLDSPGPDNTSGFGRLDAFSTAPRGRVTTDRALYRTGDTLRLSASLQPGSTLNTGDAFVFALLPVGLTPLSLIPAPDGGFIGTFGLQPLAAGFPVPSFSGEFFQFTFSGIEPPGLYLVVGTVTFSGQTPLPLNADQLEQTIIFDGTFFEFLP
jgi:subtilisin family serine protease